MMSYANLLHTIPEGLRTSYRRQENLKCKTYNLIGNEAESYTPSFPLADCLEVSLRSDQDGWKPFSFGFVNDDETTTGSLDFQKDPEDFGVILTLTSLFDHGRDPTTGPHQQIVKLPKDLFQLFSEKWTSFTLEVVEDRLKLALEDRATVHFNAISATDFYRVFAHVNQGQNLFIRFNCKEGAMSSINLGAILGGSIAAVLLLAVVIIVVCYLRKRTKLKGDEEKGTSWKHKSDGSCEEITPLKDGNYISESVSTLANDTERHVTIPKSEVMLDKETERVDKKDKVLESDVSLPKEEEEDDSKVKVLESDVSLPKEEEEDDSKVKVLESEVTLPKMTEEGDGKVKVFESEFTSSKEEKGVDGKIKVLESEGTLPKEADEGDGKVKVFESEGTLPKEAEEGDGKVKVLESEGTLPKEAEEGYGKVKVLECKGTSPKEAEEGDGKVKVLESEGTLPKEAKEGDGKIKVLESEVTLHKKAVKVDRHIAVLESDVPETKGSSIVGNVAEKIATKEEKVEIKYSGMENTGQSKNSSHTQEHAVTQDEDEDKGNSSKSSEPSRFQGNLKNAKDVGDQAEGQKERKSFLRNINDTGSLQQVNNLREDHQTTAAVAESSTDMDKGSERDLNNGLPNKEQKGNSSDIDEMSKLIQGFAAFSLDKNHIENNETNIGKECTVEKRIQLIQKDNSHSLTNIPNRESTAKSKDKNQVSKTESKDLHKNDPGLLSSGRTQRKGDNRKGYATKDEDQQSPSTNVKKTGPRAKHKNKKKPKDKDDIESPLINQQLSGFQNEQNRLVKNMGGEQDFNKQQIEENTTDTYSKSSTYHEISERNKRLMNVGGETYFPMGTPTNLIPQNAPSSLREMGISVEEPISKSKHKATEENKIRKKKKWGSSTETNVDEVEMQSIASDPIHTSFSQKEQHNFGEEATIQNKIDGMEIDGCDFDQVKRSMLKGSTRAPRELCSERMETNDIQTETVTLIPSDDDDMESL